MWAWRRIDDVNVVYGLSNVSLILCHVKETVSPEGTFCDTVQVPSNGGDMELI